MCVCMNCSLFDLDGVAMYQCLYLRAVGCSDRSSQVLFVAVSSVHQSAVCHPAVYVHVCASVCVCACVCACVCMCVCICLILSFDLFDFTDVCVCACVCMCVRYVIVLFIIRGFI